MRVCAQSGCEVVRRCTFHFFRRFSARSLARRRLARSEVASNRPATPTAWPTTWTITEKNKTPMPNTSRRCVRFTGRARLISRLLLCTCGCKYSTPALMNACADFFLRCSTRPRPSSKIFGGASRECDSCSKKSFGLLFGLEENFLLLRLSFF